MPLKPTTMVWQRDLGEQIASLLGGEAGGILSRVLEGESREGVVKDWTEMIATPAMAKFKEAMAPYFETAYNLPGSYYNRSGFEGMGRATQDFFSQNVLPTLWSSIESMKGRNLSRQGLWANLLGMGSGLSTAQTLQYAQKPTWQQEFATLMGGIQGGYETGSSFGADLAMLMR